MFIAAAIVIAAAGTAHAQTDEIQVYDAEIVEQGKFNLTLHNNFTPDGRTQPDFAGAIVPNHTLNGVPEWAYGVTDWFEAGLYLPVYSLTGDGKFYLDSAKLRALFVSPHAADRTFFYGLNFELSLNSKHWETSQFSGEMRPILGLHLGPMDFIINPILDTQFDGVKKLDFAPAERVAYNFNDKWAFALEHYADYGKVSGFETADNQQHQLFATVDYKGEPFGVEFGIGHGFTAASDPVVLKLMIMHDF